MSSKKIFISVLIFLVSLEIISSIYFFFSSPDIFKEPASFISSLVKEHEAQKGTFALGPSPHPFFGYVTRNILTDVSHSGFLTPQTLPYVKAPDEFVIAVFGGSVASFLANYIMENATFDEELKKQVPALRNKKIVILNLALPGMKQPQQFNIYSYFNDSFDMSINLDGYNELDFISPLFPVEFPLWSEVFYFPNEDTANLKGDYLGIARKRDFLISAAKNFFLARSRFFTLLWKIRWENLNYQEKTLADKIYSWDNAEGENSPFPRFKGKLAKAGAVNWARFTRLQGLLAAQLKKPALFFIQPNIHLPGTKILTEREIANVKKTARNPVSLTGFINGYRDIKAFGVKMKTEDKLKVYDLTSLFARDSREIYVDGCCHFNKDGNQAIAASIIEQIGHNLKK